MSDLRYTLYYWPIPFRGIFIRALFALRELSYEDGSVQELIELRRRPPEEQPLPFMAPPLLHDHQRARWLSQFPVILRTLAEEHELLPTEPEARLIAEKVILDSLDVLAEITRSNGAQMWDRESWGRFRGERLPRWLAIFEAIGGRHQLGEAEGTLLGGPLSVADLCCFALWGTMERSFPSLSSTLRDNAPRVMALADRVAARPQLQRFLEEERALLGERYCGGQIEASIRAMLEADALTSPSA